MKYWSPIKCQRKFRSKFRDEGVPSGQTIHRLVNKIRSTGFLIDKKQKHKRRVLTGEKLDNIRARIQHTPRKSLKRLAQETGVSKSSARTATNLLELRPYKTTIIHSTIQLAGFILQLVSVVCRRWWDRSANDVLFWWSVTSLLGVYKYAK
jgi:hypothetical protein